MSWSNDQESALKAVERWLRDPHGKQVFRLFGFAGTGKSTLAVHVASHVEGGVLFAAFTGKAAQVMRMKGCDGASTIHSLIYNAMEDEFGSTTFVLNPQSELADAGLLIVDEVSMVSNDLAQDLLSFGTRVLVLGDPAQLPPVDGLGFFTHGPNCEPDAMLTEIHRQARDNPIIHLATEVRNGRALQLGGYGESSVIAKSKFDTSIVLASDQAIVGKNVTRHSWNRRIRELKNLNPDKPVKGDKLVCLKNNRRRGLLNGGIWIADKVAKRDISYNVWVSSLDDTRRKGVAVKVRSEFFRGEEATIPKEERRYTDEFTYAYALTCHKCQGSSWPSVLVYDESSVFGADAGRWLYTAITRASQRLVLAVGDR